jgi:hypothetical protein
MKTLYLSIIAMAAVSLFSTVFPIDAQNYGLPPSEQAAHTAALQQALFEKQMEELKQKDEQLGQDSQIITLLIGVSIGLGCVTGIVTWILPKTRKIGKK